MQRFNTSLIPLLLITMITASCESKEETAIKEYVTIVGVDGNKSDSYKYGEIKLDSSHTVQDSSSFIISKTKQLIDFTFKWNTDSTFSNMDNPEYLSHYHNVITEIYNNWDSTKTYHENDLKKFNEVYSTSFGRDILVLKYNTYDITGERNKLRKTIESYRNDLQLAKRVLTQIESTQIQLQKYSKLEANSSLVEFYAVPIVGFGVYQYSIEKSSGALQVVDVRKVS